jgi:altronate dehydratase small subunit
MLLGKGKHLFHKEHAVKKNAVVIHPQDDVATAIEPLSAGQTAVMFVGDLVREVHIRQAIPVGHKFAINPVVFHGAVRKYGESIGRATAAIEVGDYVHVHNVESERGRGDW